MCAVQGLIATQGLRITKARAGSMFDNAKLSPMYRELKLFIIFNSHNVLQLQIGVTQAEPTSDHLSKITMKSRLSKKIRIVIWHCRQVMEVYKKYKRDFFRTVTLYNFHGIKKPRTFQGF